MNYADMIHDVSKHAFWLERAYTRDALAERALALLTDGGYTIPPGFRRGIMRCNAPGLAMFLARNTGFDDERPENHAWFDWCRERCDDPKDSHPSLTDSERNGGTWGGH